MGRLVLLWTLLLLAIPVHATDFYVSPTGLPSGDGSMARPWDLQTALLQPAAVKPGDTIWLRDGLYNAQSGRFTDGSYLRSTLKGTQDLPIIVRQYPGERAIVELSAGYGPFFIGGGDTATGIPDMGMGHDVWFWGFEVRSAPGLPRATDQPGSWTILNNFIDIRSPRTKLINMVIHDISQGPAFWSCAYSSEMYGTIVYHIGWNAPDRGHGHGVYTQNVQGAGLKTYADNIIFEGASEGIQAYGSGRATVADFQFTGNTIFDSGILTGYGDNYGKPQYQLLVGGGGATKKNIRVEQNMIYVSPNPSGGGYTNVGWGWDVANGDAVIKDNTFVGGDFPIAVYNWNQLTFTGNKVVGDGKTAALVTIHDPGRGVVQSTTGYIWDANSYYSPVRNAFWKGTMNSLADASISWGSSDFVNWKTNGFDASGSFTNSAPTGKWVYVRPNLYEPGRANIIIYNWDLSPTVSVDVSSAGLNIGDSYKIIDAQNFYGSPVATGTYTGQPVSIPMTGLTKQQPIGYALNTRHTAPKFGTFIILPTSLAPPDPSDRIAPVVSGVVATTTSVTATITWNTNEAGDTRVEYGTSSSLGSTTPLQNFPVASHSATIMGLQPSTTYYYKVHSADRNGNDGVAGPFTFTTKDASFDNVKPTASWVSPLPMSQVSNVVTITVEGTDNLGVAGVQFLVDGVKTGAEVKSSPYTFVFNTTAYSNGPHNISVVVRDAANNTATTGAQLSVFNYPAPAVSFSTYAEAEAGSLNSPMVEATDASASGGRFITSAIGSSGSASYSFVAPVSGLYTFWARVYAADASTDSYFVSVDGAAEDVFDVAEQNWMPAWQWSVLNGRAGSLPKTLDPRTFSLTQGTHTITVRTRDANAKLDKLFITNDFRLTPNESGVAVPQQPIVSAPVISPSGGTFGGAVLVTISSGTPDAVIYYTTNGGMPSNSSLVYSGPITVSATGSVNAIAVKTGMISSSITGVAFTIGAPPVQNQTGTTSPCNTYVEAEDGVVQGMVVGADPAASGGRYVHATSTTGSLTFPVQCNAGSYMIWARVLSPDYLADSFFVRLDGGAEDVYDTAEGTWSSNWQWTKVNGRNGGAVMSLNPRLFTMSAGLHNVTFRARDANVKIDKVIITNDMALVPGAASGVGGDINNDGVVDVRDVLLVASAINRLDMGRDVNGDGVVNIFDVVAVVRFWNP